MSDFFRGLWWLAVEYGDLFQARQNLYGSDMTIHPLNLDGLYREQAEFLESRWEEEKGRL